MPLSEAVAREPKHRRRIILDGYQRVDGLFDIEAHLTDTKPYDFNNEDRGTIAAGEPLHGMAMRMTVDATMMITGFEAATDYAPYSICTQVTPNFARLVGIRIGRGFLRAASERVGGTQGCTHLRELLQQMATVAFQMVYASQAGREDRKPTSRPALIDTCYSYGSDSSVVRRFWPEHYSGPNAQETAD